MSELKKFDESIELRRLRKLQIMIETDMWFSKDVKFDIGRWKSEKECGTTACFCGMYAMAYPEDGFKIIKEMYVHENLTETVVYNMACGTKRSFAAAALFFGLSVDESLSLFSEESYITNDEGKFVNTARDAVGHWKFEEDPRLIKAEALKRVKLVIEEKVNNASFENTGSIIAR